MGIICKAVAQARPSPNPPASFFSLIVFLVFPTQCATFGNIAQQAVKTSAACRLVNLYYIYVLNGTGIKTQSTMPPPALTANRWA